MADDAGPVQPVVDYFKNGIQKIKQFTGDAPPEQKPAPKKPDDPWHADMVKRANEEFRKQADAQQKADQQKTVPVRKDVPRKPIARKR